MYYVWDEMECLLLFDLRIDLLLLREDYLLDDSLFELNALFLGLCYIIAVYECFMLTLWEIFMGGL